MKNLVFIFLLIPFLSFGQEISLGDFLPANGNITISSDYQNYDLDITYDIKGDTLIITETKQYYSIFACAVLGCTANHNPEPEVTKRYYLIEHIFDMKCEKQLVQKMVEETVFKRVD